MYKEKLTKFYNYLILIFSVVAVIIATIDIINGLSGILIYIDNSLLIFFTIDFISRLIISKNKLLFFKDNIFDLMAIIPFNSAFKIFRIGKIGRLIRLTKLSKLTKLSRLSAYTMRFSKNITKFFNTNGFKYTLTISVTIIFISAMGIHHFEKIPLADSIWHSLVTVTTVGYGDFVPVNNISKIIDIILMITGIGMVGSLSSTITSFFIKSNTIKTQPIEFTHKNITLTEKYNILDEKGKKIVNIIIENEYERVITTTENAY